MAFQNFINYCRTLIQEKILFTQKEISNLPIPTSWNTPPDFDKLMIIGITTHGGFEDEPTSQRGNNSSRVLRSMGRKEDWNRLEKNFNFPNIEFATKINSVGLLVENILLETELNDMLVSICSENSCYDSDVLHHAINLRNKIMEKQKKNNPFTDPYAVGFEYESGAFRDQPYLFRNNDENVGQLEIEGGGVSKKHKNSESIRPSVSKSIRRPSVSKSIRRPIVSKSIKKFTHVSKYYNKSFYVYESEFVANQDIHGAFYDNIWILQKSDTERYKIWGLGRPIKDDVKTPNPPYFGQYLLQKVNERDSELQTTTEDILAFINANAMANDVRAKCVIFDFSCSCANSGENYHPGTQQIGCGNKKTRKRKNKHRRKTKKKEKRIIKKSK